MPKKAAWLLVLAVFAVLFVRYYGRGPSRNYSDFRVYHTTAVRFLQGADIYADDDPKITPFKYSPAFALVTAPLGLLPIHAASLVFFSINFGLLLFIAIISKRMLAPQAAGRRAAVLYAVPGVFVLRYALLVLDAGQVNLLMIALALGGVYFAESKREVPAGFLLGFSVMVKYVTFIFVPYWILRGKWRAAVSAVVSLFVYAWLPALFVGFGRAHRYLMDWLPHITRTSLDRGSWTDYKNQSLYSWVIRLFMQDSPYKDFSFSLLPFQAALYLGAALAVAIYAVAVFSGMGKKPPLATYAALFAGIALFNPNCWPFNYVALFFPAMALTQSHWAGKCRDRWTLFFLGAAFLLMNIHALFGDGFQYFAEVASFLAIGGLLVFAACVRLNFTKGPSLGS